MIGTDLILKMTKRPVESASSSELEVNVGIVYRLIGRTPVRRGWGDPGADPMKDIADVAKAQYDAWPKRPVRCTCGGWPDGCQYPDVSDRAPRGCIHNKGCPIRQEAMRQPGCCSPQPRQAGLRRRAMNVLKHLTWEGRP